MSKQIKRPQDRHQAISRESAQERVQMFLCLVPVFGLMPAVIALVRQRSSRKVRDVSQLAIALMLTWAIAYGAMGGVPTEGESAQVVGELVKASLSSGYFAFCMYLMYRLYRHQSVGLPWLSRDRSQNL